jgi:uncharacterized protein YfdQ (DUF2303 family)
MLTSPITITVDGVAHNLSRINQDNFTSVYLKKDTNVEYRLTIRHSYEGKAGNGQIERHNCEFMITTWDVDGNSTVEQAYVVMRTPRGGDASAQVDLATGLMAFVTTNAAALVGWES